MSRFVMKVPDVGEGVVEAELSAWEVGVDDWVDQDMPLVNVLTDKANVEISSPVSGKVLALHGKPGEIVAVGAPLVEFEVAGDDGMENRADRDDAGREGIKEDPEAREYPGNKPGRDEETTEPDGDRGAPGDSAAQKPRARTKDDRGMYREHTHPESSTSRRVDAAPSVRYRARQTNLDLGMIGGTGPAGRITHRDMDEFIADAVQGGGAGGSVRSRSRRTGTRSYEISGLRRVIAGKMSLSNRTIPHYTYVEEVDVTELDELRNMLNADVDPGREKLTYLPFIMTALVRLLPDFPYCNAHFDGGAGVVTEYDAVHIGIAAQTGQGLKVPVVRHCESLSLSDMADELRRLGEAARDNSIAVSELTGSTITLTSLGKFGGLMTTPVINKPEVAIVGINKINERPVVRNGQILARKIMNISASFDHRIVDGYDGARLVQNLRSLLECPAVMFAE